MEEKPLDELPLAVIFKAEPDWFEDESDEHADIKVEERVDVKIKEELQQESMTLTVTDAFPPSIPSDAHKSSNYRVRYSCPSSMDYRKGKLYEVGEEDHDAGIESLLDEFELNPNNKKKKNHVCLACNFEALSKHALVRHRIAIHGEQKYACKICEFKTGYLGELVKHERHHYGKGFQCSQCEFKTNHESSLVRHSVLHLNKFYCCNQCDFKTKYERSLERHRLKHTARKVHACELCRCKFFALNTLNKHRSSKHGTVVAAYSDQFWTSDFLSLLTKK